jgi:integrase
VTRRKHSNGRSNISAGQKGVGSALTLKELVEEYLAQDDAEPETIDKLRWLLAKALCAFGGRRLPELSSQEIAAWRMKISPGHRFEATQALRQVLARAVVWGMIEFNPAKQGVANPQRRRTEKRPFESWARLGAAAARLGPRYGPPVIFAAATGLRPGEWMALEQRDIDLQARVVYVRRALRNGRLKNTKTEGSIRAVPLQAIALAALDQLIADAESQLLFPSPRGGYFDLHNFRNRYWRPAQTAEGIVPRYMGASLTMIDRHYGHLPAIDASTQSGSSTATQTSKPPTSKPWTSDGRRSCPSSPVATTETAPEQEETGSPLTDSNRRPT